jgi:hypothetical protein
MIKLEKTRRIKKANQDRGMENQEKKLLNLVKSKERLMKLHNPFVSEETEDNFNNVSSIF